MITPAEFYTVMTAVVPLYVAMILAYGSVRWWKLLTPSQCSGINRFVAIFAVPLLSFQIISHNDPYQMNPRFVGADILQKFIVLAALGLWNAFKSQKQQQQQQQNPNSGLDWTITLFMVSTLPNTLVLGIPLEDAMYGKKPAALVVQAVVLQCIVWYTLLLFLFEYRSARKLVLEQFPGPAAANIVSFRIDPDVVSLEGGPEQQITSEAEVGTDGKIHVQLKRSPTPSSACCKNLMRSPGYASPAATPRTSDLTGVEIYSLQSSRNMTPTGSSYNLPTVAAAAAALARPRSGSNSLVVDTASNHSSNIHTPRELVIPESLVQDLPARNYHSPRGIKLEQLDFQKAARSKLEKLFIHNEAFSPMRLAEATKRMDNYQHDAQPRDLQMLVWSSSTSPASDRGSLETKRLTPPKARRHLSIEVPSDSTPLHPCLQHDFSFVDNVLFQRSGETPHSEKLETKLKVESPAQAAKFPFTPPKVFDDQPTQMPSAAVLTSLILRMMWRKLVRNPNTYASLLGLSWALISFRWNVGMPKLLEHSITILSDAGLGMAMFSLGLFMGLQSKLLACGTTMAIVVMIIRFVTGPAIMSATSIAVGLRNVELKASIVQAALPQGIVPFVFAKEYNVHPDVLSTAVIFGMLISLPIDLLYYVLLGL